MTETEWLTCTEPSLILRSFHGQVSDRKLRLFACGCCRSYPGIDDDPVLRAAVEAVEKFSDGLIGGDDLPDGSKYAHDPLTRSILSPGASRAAFDVAYHLAYRRPISLLRDVMGNPFRPVAVDARWLTSLVIGLAQGIYADRAFDRLPILADALEDAGCDNAELLAHCRNEGPHIRGCWAIDLVLGKE